jgi:membrane protease YdiL (CAAX protease family)
MDKLRWLAVLILGFVAWYAAAFVAAAILQAVGMSPDELVGLPLAVYGILRIALFVPALQLILRMVGQSLADLGFSLPANWRQLALPGLVLGLAWPLLQLFVLIPVTGGAAREDVVASRALIGGNLPGLFGAILLSWTLAAIGEELFFRSHIIASLRGILGQGRLAALIAVAASVVFFAVTHAYQGLIGMLDVGLFGLLLAWLYLRSNSLLPSILAHGLSNTILFLGLHFLY